MLNKNGTRELAYIVRVDAIEPIEGRDRVESAIVGGWTIMVRKDQFHPGDLGIYFEIDSQVPEKEPFMFLESKHFKIKTQKYRTPNGQFWSQGLLMHPSDFGWITAERENDNYSTMVIEKNGTIHQIDDDSRFLTSTLGVIYAVSEDNTRKADSEDKYKKMTQRHAKLFKNPIVRKIMRYDWGRKVMFFFFGRKKDKKTGWPEWVKKTDEERVQNMPWVLQNKDPWIATEKIDGTSTTFTMKRSKHKKFDFYICSRNVVFDKPDKTCFYDSNVYIEMAEKYHIEDTLREILLSHPEFDWITLQGETYGAGIQKRDYSLNGHDFMGFNFITSVDGRWNSIEASKLMFKYGVPWVPIINENFILPDTVEELLAIATDKSVVDGGMREGLVFRSQDGSQSFKAVSNEFLMKYHNG